MKFAVDVKPGQLWDGPIDDSTVSASSLLAARLMRDKALERDPPPEFEIPEVLQRSADGNAVVDTL